MSYRLISKAALSINATTPIKQIEIRAFPSPKGAVKGKVQVDGEMVEYKLTSGAGRGAATKFYVYIPYKGLSGYFEASADEFAVFKNAVGSDVFIVSAPTTETKPVEPVAKPVAETTPVAKAKRRVKEAPAALV